MRIRLQFHAYRLIVPVVNELKSEKVEKLVDFITKYLQEHFNNTFIKVVELSTSDRYALNNSDIVSDVINDNEVLICMDEQLFLEREVKVYCDRKNAWLHVERKKIPKSKKRRSSVSENNRKLSSSQLPTDIDTNISRPRRSSAVSIVESSSDVSSPKDDYVPKWAEVGYNTRNKIYVLLGVGSYTQLYLFSLDELRENKFQEQRIGIIEDDTGDWYTLAKFEKENIKKDDSDEAKDEAVAAIGLHVKAEGDQMANAEQIIIRVTKDGLLTTELSEVTHLFGTKSGKRPRKKKHLEDE